MPAPCQSNLEPIIFVDDLRRCARRLRLAQIKTQQVFPLQTQRCACSAAVLSFSFQTLFIENLIREIGGFQASRDACIDRDLQEAFANFFFRNAIVNGTGNMQLQLF